MAVPFRKVSNTRGRKRRTHYKISDNKTVKCPKCGSMHTYPAGVSNLGGLFGPGFYKKIWDSQDMNNKK